MPSPNRSEPRPRRIAAAFLAVFGLAACATAPEQPPAAAAEPVSRELVRGARTALDDGLLDDAMWQYGRILAVDPQNIEARLGVAEIRLARGETRRAKEVFEQLTDQPDARARALQGRGLALLILGQREVAETALVEAVGADPALWRAWNALGQIHDAAHRWAEAREAYEQALTGRPGAPIVLNNMAFSLMLQGHMDAAVPLLLEALKGDPRLEVAQNNLRLALAWQGRYLEALAGVPTDKMSAALNNVGYVAMLRGDRRAAEAYLTRAIEASPSYNAVASKNLVRLEAMRADAKED